MRLPLSEPLPARCSATRAIPTCIAMLSVLKSLRLAESERFDHLVKCWAKGFELVGRGRARDQVRRGALDHRDLEAARLVIVAGRVALGKGVDASHGRVAGGAAQQRRLRRIARHLMLHREL